jgi:hypothetical protein
MNGRKLSTPAIRTTVYLPEALHLRAKLFAARHRTSVTQLMVAALKAQLKEDPSQVAGK